MHDRLDGASHKTGHPSMTFQAQTSGKAAKKPAVVCIEFRPTLIHAAFRYLPLGVTICTIALLT
jgi:hypothetical protein